MTLCLAVLTLGCSSKKNGSATIISLNPSAQPIPSHNDDDDDDNNSGGCTLQAVSAIESHPPVYVGIPVLFGVTISGCQTAANKFVIVAGTVTLEVNAPMKVLFPWIFTAAGPGQKVRIRITAFHNTTQVGTLEIDSAPVDVFAPPYGNPFGTSVSCTASGGWSYTLPGMGLPATVNFVINTSTRVTQVADMFAYGGACIFLVNYWELPTPPATQHVIGAKFFTPGFFGIEFLIVDFASPSIWTTCFVPVWVRPAP